MRFEHNGKSLWYGTEDAPAPGSVDSRRALTLEYAALAGLDQARANLLLERNLTYDRLTESALSNLVRDKVLSAAQKVGLHLMLELGRLTGDNLAFVASLKARGVRTTADPIGWTRSKWEQMIVEDKIVPPAGETVAGYIENILLNLDRGYPSQVLLNSLLDEWPTRLAQIEVPDNPTSNELTPLTAFANAYRHLGTLQVLADEAIKPSQKKEAIATRLLPLDAFYQDNPGLDLRPVDFFNSDDRNLVWENVPEKDRPTVRRQLMAYQRALNLADSNDDRQALLNRGYDSALAVVAKTEAEFLAESGLPSGRARMIYHRAQETALQVSLESGTIRDLVRGGFTDIAVNNLPTALVNDLRDLDGFDDLFGPQDFCDCEGCKSVLGPAAYFVDLMSFIERHVSKPAFIDGGRTDSPLYLRNRREDLWALQLTCENTHADIPYLTIVNEVLERYLGRTVQGDIFQRMSGAAEKSSFALPFNLSLAELRLYLSHFGVRLHDVYRLLKEDEAKVWRERLQLSKEEFGVIATPDTADVARRFGNRASWADFPVPDFIRAAGINRQQLDELLTMKFNPDVRNVRVERLAVPDELQNFPEVVRNLTANRADFIHRFIRLWRKTGWSLAELDLVLNTMKESGLTGTDFTVNNGAPVLYLARLLDMQERLSLTVEEVCSLIDESPTAGRQTPLFFASLPVSGEFPKQPTRQAERRLYERLFDLRKLFGENAVTRELNTSAAYHHYSFNTVNPNDQTVDPGTPILLSGLGVSETELLLLFELLSDQMPFDPQGNTTLDRQRISLLYRHARLARALKLSVEDFIQTLRLNFAPGDLVVRTLGQIERLVRFKDWLKLSPFNVPKLRFILKGEEAAAARAGTNLEAAGAIVREVQGSQLWDKATPERETRIVREVQGSQAADPSERLQDSLSNFFGLSLDRLLEILDAVGADIEDAEIQGALNAVLIDGVPEDPADLDPLRELLEQIEEFLSVETLKTSLVRSFNLTAEQLEDLLRWVAVGIDSAEVAESLKAAFTDGVPDTPADLNGLLNLMRGLERVLLLFNDLKLKDEDIAYLTRRPAVLGIADLKALTLERLEALTVYKSLTLLDEEAELVVQTLLDEYLASGTFSDVAGLADLWRQEHSLVESLVNALTLSAVPIEAVEYIREALRLCETLGLNGYSLQRLAGDADFAAVAAARDVALGAFSSRYEDEKARQENLEPYRDRVNVAKRDALCDYIIAREGQLRFRDLDDVYAFFLLDVEMSGCARTSRVISAILSLQLYAHRVLANLERSATEPSLVVLSLAYEMEAFRREWEWRKNYRVWEANRKVFLYPENYIEPGLRDDKTPLFRELEEELLQQKIGRESAADAYRKYVTGLTELAKLRIVGSYYHEDDLRYYLFGRTHTQPYQYYFRTLDLSGGASAWGHWVRIELPIEAGEVSALVHLRRLYLFWTQVERRELGRVETGSAQPGGHLFKVAAKFSGLDERGKWSAPQKVNVGYMHFEDPVVGSRVWPGTTPATDGERTAAAERFAEEVFRKPYPVLTDDPAWPIRLYYIWTHGRPLPTAAAPVNVTERYSTAARNETESYLQEVNYNRVDRVCEMEFAAGTVHLPVYNVSVANGSFPVSRSVRWELEDADGSRSNRRGTLELLSPAEAEIEVAFPGPGHVANGCTGRNYQPTRRRYQLAVQTLATPPPAPYAPSVSSHELSLASNLVKDAGDIKPKFEPIANHLFLQPEYEAAYAAEDPGSYVQNGTEDFTGVARAVYQRQWNSYELTAPERQGGINLSTILIDELSQLIFARELDEFLSPETQTGFYTGGELDFAGPYGNYYRELFFHIPFLIANHLNANQQFGTAQWWYERIFHPTHSDPPVTPTANDRVWRYSQFRNLAVERLRDILLDGEAIRLYKEDPLNPHAIARRRPSAYQKAIVMKFIDNLLDWGDHLFAQDTTESINEATMLYILAADILGKRPEKPGKCETAADGQLTYGNLGPALANGVATENSEFLIALENWVLNGLYTTRANSFVVPPNSGADSFNAAAARSLTTGGTALEATARADSFDSAPLWARSGLRPYLEVGRETLRYDRLVARWETAEPGLRLPGFDIVQQQTLAFCVPSNDELLKYWGRVEDRLFKIRHCMNISGVRRRLALFQPPIDPAVLVRARAAGLSLEEILDVLAAPAPRYRFSVLVEKAKQFTQTVQSFGTILLSALEKKDIEELALLRSLHERNILGLTKEVKRQQVNEAQHQHQSMTEARANVQNRADYYRGLIGEGLSGWEIAQQVARHTATGLIVGKGALDLVAGILYVLPQIGSPFAMKYGGKEQGDSGAQFADWLGDMAGVAESISASAAMEAGFQRREQEWQQQLLSAEQELKQVEQQVLAADVRRLIAERELEAHEENIEQAGELDEFYKNRFTNLGLFDYLSTTLTRLYREAYRVAQEMARMAERAFQFERDDDTAFFIAGDNWQFDRAGLLAGERLLLQLQRMEKAYLEQHRRDYEVEQSFSLGLLNPSALLALRETGSCEFTIPEVMFDLCYPGQYRRLIKSVRVSIPCVTGPYINTGAKLTLKNYRVRRAPVPGPLDLIVPGETASIATSSGQNDGGLFELNFRDERYLPFEGAGAVDSTWGLELPSLIRLFDYDTISDVIVHVSYTAKDGGVFRDLVETELAAALVDFASTNGLSRLLSLKHEFPSAFHRLLNPAGEEQTTTFDVTERHFPHFLTRIPADPEGRRGLALSEATIYLKPKGDDPVATAGLTLAVNGANNVNNWTLFGDNLRQGAVSLSGSPLRRWTLSVAGSSLDKDDLDDVLLLLRYGVS